MQYRSVTVLAPAKLNLSLDVVGTLPNGYHDLDMVMQTIDLYEKITLRRSHDLTLNLPGSFVPANDKNTAVKAALAFFAYTGLLAGVDMTIYKRVPVRAGMAGGSADAAGVLELGAGLALALTVVLTAYADWHRRTAARVRADTVRLHILANSDTWDDQLLKLQVRDAVLAALPPAVTQAQSPQQAVRALQTALPALQTAADSALHRAHSPQTAALRLESHDFSARDYGSFSLPGGEYTALRIELGTAQGRNWFCVLYPSLCISGSTATYPGADENALVFGRFEIRCAVADFIGRLASPAGEAVSGLPAD